MDERSAIQSKRTILSDAADEWTMILSNATDEGR